jgi:hypothetical protein
MSIWDPAEISPTAHHIRVLPWRENEGRS